MSRLQKKCFFASAGLHGLLLSLFILSPAFLPKQEKFENLQIITFIPGKLIDEPFVGGGTPNAAPPPASRIEAPTTAPPEIQAQPPVEPEPVKPAPKPEKRIESPPEPERVKPQKSLEPTPVSPKNKRETEKPVADLSETPKRKPPAKITPTFDKSSENPAKQAQAEANAARLRAASYQARLNQMVQSLDKNLSTGTEIGIPGPGTGAYMNYGLAIKAIFDAAWRPGDLAENDSTVTAAVTILRDGTVASYEILKASRILAMDRSVERALMSVKTVPPFPEGAKEEKREYKFNFNLQSKRLSR
jgi:TonB family protein